MTPRARARVQTIGVAAALIVAAACSSPTSTATDDSSTTSTAPDAPTTVIEAGLTSDDPATVPTTNPTTESSVVPTSSTTTTTTTTIPDVPVNVRAELDVDAVFEPILDELIEFTRIPIRLPADLDLDPGAIANLTSVDADHYVVHIGVAPGCTGGNVCRIGTFSGYQAETLEALIGDVEVPVGTPVPLPGRDVGEFLDATCGANCGDGTVSWEEADVVYSVGAKLAPGPDMLVWAWSAIDADAVAPTPPEFCGPDTVAANGTVAALLDADTATTDLHWLVVCSEEGLFAEVVDGPADIRWFELGEDRGALAVEKTDGQTLVFRVGIVPEALIDQATFGRFVARDLRCGDANSDGRVELADASTDRVYEISTMAVEIEIAADVEALPAC